ncbi:hypothetical protein ACWGPT_19200 [Pseudorhizobium sp. NPDC055634]
MLKFLVSTAVTGLIILAPATATLAEGEYYEGASKDVSRSVRDTFQTNSTTYGYANGEGRSLFGKTSRDNRQIGDRVTVDSGDYYQGASRPN